MLHNETDDKAPTTTAVSMVASTIRGEYDDSDDDSLNKELSTENMPQALPKEPLFGGLGAYDGGWRTNSARRGDKLDGGRRAAPSDSALWGEHAHNDKVVVASP